MPGRSQMEQSYVLPPIQPHTVAKHDILRRHLAAWFPILGRGSRSNRLLYIDGFAGPGEYASGENGSPIIALEDALGHSYLPEFVAAKKRLDFVFVERDQRFVEHLRSKVAALALPAEFHVTIRHADFESTMTGLLDQMDADGRTMPPTFAFIYPFGPSGFSMSLLARLTHGASVDILVNFNYMDQIRWMLPDSSKHGSLDRLYGTPRWRPALSLIEPRRKDFLIEQYAKALKEAGWSTTDFEMVNRQNQTPYYLFFATRSHTGMAAMKGAMRRVSPEDPFRYADRTNPTQPRLFGMGMDDEYAQELGDRLIENWRGQEVAKERLIEEVIHWHPRWMEKDLTAALRLVENLDPPRIVDVRNADGRRRRRNSHPTGSFITFAP